MARERDREKRWGGGGGGGAGYTTKSALLSNTDTIYREPQILTYPLCLQRGTKLHRKQRNTLVSSRKPDGPPQPHKGFYHTEVIHHSFRPVISLLGHKRGGQAIQAVLDTE